jgi:hypothetical protein
LQNPFSEAAAEIIGRIAEIKNVQDAAKAAAQAEKDAAEASFKRALALFDRMKEQVQDYVRLTNEALGRDDIVVKTKIEPVKKDNAGVITVVLNNGNNLVKSFRFVGNASFKAYVHDVGEPRYEVFDLTEVDSLPYQEIFSRFLSEVSALLEKRAAEPNV